MSRPHHRAAATALGFLLIVGAGCGVDTEMTAAAATHAIDHTARPGANATRTDRTGFHQQTRKLWEQHVAWTRLFIVAAVAGAPDTQATTDRLLRNQDDIGNAIKPFYGDAAGAELTSLLHSHITTAAELLAAAAANDTAALTTAKDAWYANADEIAAFLSRANPRRWPKSTLEQMMRAHLDQTLTEATDQLTGDYAGSIAEYDHIEDHILDMADALADGIVAQFPSRFTGPGGGAR